MELRRRLRSGSFLLLAASLQIVAAAFSVSVLFTPAVTNAQPTVPYLINFQGKLADSSGNILPDGSYNVKFRLFIVSTGGSNVWEEDRVAGSPDHRITVQDGLFNVQLGSVTTLTAALFDSYTEGNLYLEVELPTPASATCATSSCAVWTEGPMTPRQPLASSAYAINADNLGGLNADAYGQLAAANSYTGTNLFTPTSGVAITVQPPASTDSINVENHGGSVEAYFDANGILNVAQTIQATVSTANIGTSGTPFGTGYFGTAVQTPALNATSSGGTITSNSGTIQDTNSGGLTLDLKNVANTTLTVTNSGGGVAGISATGGLTIGTGQVITVGSSAGTSNTCTGSQVLSGLVYEGGVITGGTCVSAGGGDQLVGTWTSQQGTTATGTQTTVQFTGSANSAPSFNNSTHVLTLPSNASKLIIQTKGGGGGGGSIYDAAVSDIKMSGGGGEGGMSTSYLTAGLAVNYYFQVGGGGNGGANTAINPGITGGSTCFGTNSSNACTTPTTASVGGSGGAGTGTVAAVAAGGAGGAAASGAGDVTVSGANGGNSTGAADTYSSGSGGGEGGGASVVLSSAAGNNGVSGGGGSGAADDPASATNRAGGNGGPGYLSVAVYVTTAGTGSPATLQTAYNNSTTPDIVLGTAGVTVDNSSGGVAGDLLDVQNNGGTINYLSVNSSGIGTSGTVTSAGDVNSTGGGFDTASTQRIDNAGDLENIGSITGSDNNTTGTINSLTATNSGISGTGSLTDVGISLAGTATSGTNNLTGVNYGNVTSPGGTNNYYAENYGTGYTDLLTYNNSTVIVDGSGQVNGGQLQASSVTNTALSSGTFSSITGTGTLTTGALGTGFTAVNVAQGGTGDNTITANDILQGNGTGAVTGIAPGGAGTVLVSGGTTATFTTISNSSLSSGTYTNITGTGTLSAGALGTGFTAVNVAQGGTGDNTITANDILQGNGTGAVTGIAPGGAGTVLVSGGTTATFSTITNTSLASGSFSNITGTGALSVGSITTGFSTINTANSITGSSLSAGSGAITGGSATLSNNTNQLVLGTTNTSTITMASLTQGQIITIPNDGGATENLCTALASSCNGTYQAAGNYLIQAPTSTATNTITPTLSTTGLTVNGSSTATLAFAVNQGFAANAENITVTGATVAADLNINNDNASGTNTAALAIANSGAGTLDYGLTFTGTTTDDDIYRGSGVLTLQGAGGVTLATNASGTITIGGTTGSNAIAIGATGSSANATTVDIADSSAGIQTVTVGSISSTSSLSLQGGYITATNGQTGVSIGNGFASANTGIVPLTLSSDSNFSSDETASANCSATANQGSLYYNSASGSVRGCINGAWEDVVSTSGLGLVLFGIVPDEPATTGTGDLPGIGGYNYGPCKVYVGASTTTLAWNSCVAYSGGRKVLVAAGTLTPGATLNDYQSLCLSSATSQPALSAPETTETNSALYPGFNVGSPVLCLAIIKIGTTASTIADIYDTRVYTTDVKTLGILDSNTTDLGTLLRSVGTAGLYEGITATGTPIMGVLGAWGGTLSTTTPNAVIIIGGPSSVQASAAVTVGDLIEYSATNVATGVAASSGATVSQYQYAGVSQTSWAGSATHCALDTACTGSMFFNIDIR